MFEPTHATVIFCVLVGAVFCMLWTYFDRRDRANFEVVLRKSAFHCIRCNQIYSGTAGSGQCVCPRCGHENTRLRF
jgi:uncharacterized paraquat-inducible protein A